MARFARHVCALLVAIALVAAQVMPAWAGCHSLRHAMVSTANPAAADMSSHHHLSASTDMTVEPSVTAADPSQPSPNDVCFGYCGCVCGHGGAFVPTTVTAIAAPQALALPLQFASLDPPPGGWPDGPRRPPRTTA